MRIAYLVPYVPNLIRTRPYNLITKLSSAGHDVVVFTLGAGEQDAADVEALKSKGIEVHYQEMPVWRSLFNSVMALPTRQPLQTVYSWHPAMAGRLAEVLGEQDSRRRFDVVHIEHLRGSKYGRFIRMRFPSQPVVWDSVDSISHLFRQASSHSRSLFGRLVTRLELPRTERAEGELTCLFEQVLITSEVDKQALLRLIRDRMPPAPISVLPNGVDLDYFRPNSEVKRDSEAIVFSGKMSYHANISMVKYLVNEIMPRVWAKRPQTKLVVVGKDPGPEIRSLGRNPLVTITGTVDDLRPYLWRATVSAVPLLYGAGIQNKILEAMATGTPVITTSKAMSSLGAVSGQDLLVADEPGGFAMRIVDLLENPSLRQAVGYAGLQYVQNRHHWGRIVEQLVEVYTRAVARK